MISYNERAGLAPHLEGPGDLLRYAFDKDRIVIVKVKTEAEDDPFAAFTEWSSEADERACKSL
ncbi:MAG TPA: hypothetical protein VGB91_00585 [Rhizomicrobium sp.]